MDSGIRRDKADMWFLAVVAAVTNDGQWWPSIGDPTLYGWLSVAGYLGAAWACWRVYRAEVQRGAHGRIDGNGQGRHGLAARGHDAGPEPPPPAWQWPWFWGLLATVMVVLGLNKQIDLQTLVTVLGRRMAQEQGWYARRHEYQKLFVMGLAAAGLTALVGGGWLCRRDMRRRWPALLGIMLLIGFIVLRASSFHHVDRGLFHTELGGLTVNRVLELGGIVVISLAAERARWLGSRPDLHGSGEGDRNGTVYR